MRAQSHRVGKVYTYDMLEAPWTDTGLAASDRRSFVSIVNEASSSACLPLNR